MFAVTAGSDSERGPRAGRLGGISRRGDHHRSGRPIQLNQFSDRLVEAVTARLDPRDGHLRGLNPRDPFEPFGFNADRAVNPVGLTVGGAMVLVANGLDRDSKPRSRIERGGSEADAIDRGESDFRRRLRVVGDPRPDPRLAQGVAFDFEVGGENRFVPLAQPEPPRRFLRRDLAE